MPTLAEITQNITDWVTNKTQPKSVLKTDIDNLFRKIMEFITQETKKVFYEFPQAEETEDAEGNKTFMFPLDGGGGGGAAVSDPYEITIPWTMQADATGLNANVGTGSAFLPTEWSGTSGDQILPNSMDMTTGGLAGGVANFVKSNNGATTSNRGTTNGLLIEKAEARMLVSMPILSDATETYLYQIGFAEPGQAGNVEPINHVMARIEGNMVSLIARAGTSAANAVSTMAQNLWVPSLTPNRIVDLHLKKNFAAGTVELFLDGVLLASLISGLPARNKQYFALQQIIKLNNSTARTIRVGNGYVKYSYVRPVAPLV